MSEGLADLRLEDLRARGSETRSNPSLCKQKCVYTSLFGARALAIPLPRHRMHQGAEAVPAVTSSRGEVGSGHRVPLGARIAGCRQHDPHSGVHPPPTQQRSGIWCHGRPHLGKADSSRSKAPCGGRKPKGCQRHVSTHGQCPRMRNHKKKNTAGGYPCPGSVARTKYGWAHCGSRQRCQRYSRCNHDIPRRRHGQLQPL